MVVVGENQGASKAPVALLDDARKRREQHTAANEEPRHPTPEEPGEDYSGYALDLAESLLTGESGPASSATPDEILAQHQTAAASAPSSPVREPRKNLRLTKSCSRSKRTTGAPSPVLRAATPRGSAELARSQQRNANAQPPRKLTVQPGR